MADIFVGDIGTVFRLTVKDQDGVAVDLSTASSLAIWFRRPDGSSFSRTASLYSGGTSGGMQYASVDGDLDQEGRWQMQGAIELGGSRWRTSITTFRVKAVL